MPASHCRSRDDQVRLDGHDGSAGDDRSKAEAVHAKFLGAYGLAASQVPLLHVAPVKAWYTQWGIESFEET